MNTDALLKEFAAWSPVETVAAALGLIYLILAARRSLWCWLCAFISSGIYCWLFLDRQLYQQSLLQIFYVWMAIYGYLSWRGKPGETEKLAITRWPLRRHIVVAAGVLILTCVTGWFEQHHTKASMPYLDAFTTWGAVITTWMVARKVIENWLYWLAVDSASAWMCFKSGLPATTLLFIVYLGIVIAGYFSWRRTLDARQPATQG